MNTRMLLTAVLRNRRSQWTLLPKADVDPGGEADDTAAPAAQPARDCAPSRPEPVGRPQ